jgi:hypothetical protein
MMMAAGGWYIYTGGVVPHDVLPEDVGPSGASWKAKMIMITSLQLQCYIVSKMDCSLASYNSVHQTLDRDPKELSNTVL